MITSDAYALPHGRAKLDRAGFAGSEVIRLASDRLSGFKADSSGRSSNLAKTAFDIVVSAPGQRKLQPIPLRRTLTVALLDLLLLALVADTPDQRLDPAAEKTR